MGYLNNSIHHGRLFVRCHMCGDSEKRDYVAHLGIELSSGLYYCHRCNEGGILDSATFLELTFGQYDIPISILPISHYISDDIDIDNRDTLLSSSISEGYRQWNMRNCSGDIIGVHRRELESKSFVNIGKRGLGYSGKYLNPQGYLRVVEGVYDVQIPDSCCVFGKISYGSLKILQHYDLCICPDSDIIYNVNNLKRLYYVVSRYSNVEYVEVLPKGKDPYDMGIIRGNIVKRKRFLERTKEILCGKY